MVSNHVVFDQTIGWVMFVLMSFGLIAEHLYEASEKYKKKKPAKMPDQEISSW